MFSCLLWLQFELLELHPVAKGQSLSNSWFPDHKLKIWDLPSLNLLLSSLYFFPHQYELIMYSLPLIKSKVNSVCMDILGVVSCSWHRKDRYLFILHAQYLTLINFSLKLQFCARASSHLPTLSPCLHSDSVPVSVF